MVQSGNGPVPHFLCWIIDFLCFALMRFLHHVHPFSSQAESRAALQFPDCIACSPPVPWRYNMLPSSSQTVLRATLQFPDCITCPHIPFGDTWRDKLYIYYTVCSQTVSRARPHISFGDTWRDNLSTFHRLFLLCISN